MPQGFPVFWRENRRKNYALCAVVQMGIDVCRRGKVAVSQPILNLLHQDTVCQHERGTTMPLRYHRLTRAHMPDSASFRRFSPFSLWRAPARPQLKRRKSLENPSLSGAKQFWRPGRCSGNEKAAGNTFVFSRTLKQHERRPDRQNHVCSCQSMVGFNQHTVYSFWKSKAIAASAYYLFVQ